MVYWIVVLSIWIVSILMLFGGGIFAFRYLQNPEITNLVITIVLFALGLFMNFLVVNWPVEAPSRGFALDERTLEALKVMAKTVPLAPKAVKEGLEKIIERYGG
jgi:uncharacterized membrane protein